MSIIGWMFLQTTVNSVYKSWSRARVSACYRTDGAYYGIFLFQRPAIPRKMPDDLPFSLNITVMITRFDSAFVMVL